MGSELNKGFILFSSGLSQTVSLTKPTTVQA